jgi:hypothetical protein
MMLVEATAAYFKVLFQHSPEELSKTTEHLSQNRWCPNQIFSPSSS